MNQEIKDLIEEHLYEVNEYGVRHQKPNPYIPEELIEYFEENYKIKTDVHKTCIACQMRQIDKYDLNEFKVQCGFIPIGLPPGSKKKMEELAKETEIPIEQAKKIMLATVDSVARTELMFGFHSENPNWNLRPYQKEQLRCTSRRLVIREGRRSGKTFSIVLKCLDLVFNKKMDKGFDANGHKILLAPRIMIVTPFQAQLTNFFEEAERLLKRNIELKTQVVTGTGDNLYIKTPSFKMEFKNGGLIQGFVSGIGIKQDGSGGGTMRGQSADIIYLDEMDMIPLEILDKVINPILATTPETILIATSTPIGKREKFYQWCIEREDFKEDFLPSNVIPHWDKIKEEVIRESTHDSFMAEYMGLFIDGEEGVFKNGWVQNARSDYEYNEGGGLSFISQRLGISDYLNSIIAIGIDWNKNAGTEFFVSAFSPSSGFWYALDAINVPSTEFSAQRWIRELIKLNYKWKPNYIYADEGYGHTIIEDIRLHSHRLKNKPNKTAVDHETVKILDRLTSFNFSQTINLKDPVSNADIKKSGKHFLVENAIRTFQEGLFKFPASDESLVKQLGNYIVARRSTTTNKPVYGMINKTIGDHRLDALMLSLGALALEESVYSGKFLEPSVPQFIPDNRKKNEELSPTEEARKKLNQLKKNSMPGMFEVLQIIRASENDDNEGRKRMQHSSEVNRTRRNSSKDTSSSILEGINTYLGTENSSKPIGEIYPSLKRRGNSGSKSRSWRKR